MNYDAIVVGAGIEGSAAAYQLVKKGVQNVLLLEQFERCHLRGSSCGLSRIIRMAYKKSFYIPMMTDAFNQWSNLEKESGITLYKRTGYLEMGQSDSKELNDTIDGLRMHQIAHEVFSGQEAMRRYPLQLTLPNTHLCVYEEKGGILYAQRALQALQQQFQEIGGILLDKHKVIKVIPGEVVTVVTNRGSFKAKNILIAAGAWTPTLCSSIGLHLPLKVERVEVHYWKVENPRAFSSDVFPTTFGYVDDDKFHYYGLPIEEYPDMIKICSHTGIPVDPDNRDDTSDPVTISEVAQYRSSTFKGVATQPSITEYCMFTNSPDYDPIVDRHPHYPNVIIAAGFTGHGFKLGPVFGKLLAELVMRQSPSHDLYPFRIARFQVPKPSL